MRKQLFHFKKILPYAALAALVGCQIQDIDIQGTDSVGQKEVREVIITADLADNPRDTRTSYDEAESKNYWSPGDKIKIFSAGEASEFTSLNSVPETIVKFKGLISFITGTSNDSEDSKDYVWGLYPYSDEASYSDPDGISRTARITTNFKGMQTGVPGSFADNLAVMVGRSESLSIPFKGAYSGAFFKVSRNDIVSMTLKGLNNETLAGKATIGLDGNLMPVVYDVEDPKTSVTVTAPDGTFEPGENYYLITLPDVPLPDGYSVTLRRRDGYEGTYELRANRPLNRIKFRNLSDPIDSRIESEANIASGISTGWVRASNPDSHEIWYTTSDNSELTYNPRPKTDNPYNVVEASISPEGNNGIGIIRFKEPVYRLDDWCFSPAYNPSGFELTSVTLPETCADIGEYAFYDCSSLTEVKLGPDVTQILGYAFYGCGFETITLPETLTLIGPRAFTLCENIREITIPDNVESIGIANDQCVATFDGCYNLKAFHGKFATDDGRCLIIKHPESGLNTLVGFATAGLSGGTYELPSGLESIGVEVCGEIPLTN
ncbi:MAG: leucine-rich repeat domain-containing protein, partial [Bacteroidales bacterium]|nr:leucine-rich repeat domain-containing protein [Bacteroidales bacterium]